MKKYFLIMGLCAVSLSTITSCKKEFFEDVYRDPSKVTSATVEKQFAGFIYTNREMVVPSYWNYFVILRTTAIRYTQATGWANETNQLTPGAAAISDRWSTYYSGLAQFRELEKLYNSSSEAEKEEKKIFMLAAKVFFYDQTEKVVDLFGDIPWSAAGMLSSNGGDYSISYPAYDKAEDIYTAMLDDLKSISDELGSLTLPATVTNSFKTQDLINNGNLDLWKKYCNSLRLRMLTRVSASPAFTARATQELTQMITNQAAYPFVLSNADNIQLDVFNTASDINAKGFRDGIESWNANIASKVMIDYMKSNNDPRLSFMFEPGESAEGEYIGLDQSLGSATQTALINSGTISIYNRSTYSRNEYFPGILISASEVNFLLSEYYLRNGESANAKSSFENGVKQSIAMLQSIRSISNDNTVAAPVAPTSAQVDAYISNLGWDDASNKLHLLATQKWLAFNIVQPLESWSEVRRLDYPVFNFRVESSDIQKTVPVKWNLPNSEPTYNATNYDVVKGNDNVNTKLFWDVN